MPCDIPYGKAVAIAGDQFVNAVFRGWPDETLSSRAHRRRLKGKPRFANCIDRLFFWDRDRITGKRHCELSFDSEREGRQLPPEARGGENAG